MIQARSHAPFMTMSALAVLENINGSEILLIFEAVLLLWGTEGLPGLFKSLGNRRVSFSGC